MGEMVQALALRTPLHSLILRSRRAISPALRAFSSSSSASEDRSRGGLPRFHAEVLPPCKGGTVRVQGDEFWHMTKVLRLRVNDRVELFNGRGGVVEGYIHSIDRSGLDFVALNDPKTIASKSIQWHVFAAFGSLKGGRGDWLVEKCTELGASSITPLLTERSPSITENRVDRLDRVILAAVKQCQRLHEMALNPPMKLNDFLPVVSNSKLAFLAAAGETPLVKRLYSTSLETNGLIIVGPEGVEDDGLEMERDEEEDSSGETGTTLKLTRSQRKRLRKRKLKEAAVAASAALPGQRRKIIGPLLPSAEPTPGPEHLEGEVSGENGL